MTWISTKPFTIYDGVPLGEVGVTQIKKYNLVVSIDILLTPHFNHVTTNKTPPFYNLNFRGEKTVKIGISIGWSL